ncbi:MAG: DMT family transporter [Pseudomonadota bacterium]
MDRKLVFAAAIMSIGMLMIPLGDTAGKLLTEMGLHPLFVAWARYVGGLLFMVPFAFRRTTFPLFFNWRIWLRSAVQTLTIASILTALLSEPIANVYGAFFLGPLVSYLLSVWLLKEQGNRIRLVLLMISLAGVFLVVKPGFGMSSGLGWALLSGIFYGCFLTASRWVQPLGHPLDLLIAQLVIGVILLTPFGMIHLPEALPWGLLAWSAAASLVANLLLVFAYARAGASFLAPFIYVQLVGAMTYGALIFGTWPDAVAFIGLGIIFVSGFATLFLRTNRPGA